MLVELVFSMFILIHGIAIKHNRFIIFFNCRFVSNTSTIRNENQINIDRYTGIIINMYGKIRNGVS